MLSTQNIQPVIGDWYRSHGQLFEVVATDEAEGVIEIQHADGSLEEMELEDWTIRVRAGSLDKAESPEDAAAATDYEEDEDHDPSLVQSTMDDARGLRADSLTDLDLFD
jgi:hypothetical protein